MGKIVDPKDYKLTTADAVVIGGGMVGASTAFWLSKAGFKTVVIEKRDGLSTLTTAASAECFRTQFTEKAMADLVLPSVEIFENFKDVVKLPNIDIGLTQRGYLFVTDDPDSVADLEKSVQKFREIGIPGAEFIKGEQLHKRFPFLAPNALAATFNNRDGWISTHEATYGFAKAAQNAKFFIKTEVTALQTDEKGICGVETSKGTIHTRLVVNCAGPYAGVIGKMAGLDIPLKTVKRQKVYIRTSFKGFPENAPFTVDLVNHSYWRPEAGGLLCAWVNPDEPESAPADELATEWDFAAESIHRASRLSPFFETIAEDLKVEDIDVSAGYYVYTPDDQPVIGPSDEVKGLYLNCGYWCGVMMSPQAGRRVADLVTGKMDNRDNPLRYSRFKEGSVEKGDTFLK